jgi:5-methylcytosine-specific restriction protein A
MSPIRLCSNPTCPNKATVRGRCAEHAAELRKATRSPFDSFYASKPWRLARSAYLFAHPLCEYVDSDGNPCAAIAEHVHHIVELTDGGAKRDPANLQAVCRSHHAFIHMQRRRGTVAG